MKRLFYVAAVILIFAACSEETEDPRAKFVGEYEGTVTVNVYINNEWDSRYTEVRNISITMGAEHNVIVFNDGIEATINETNYSIKPGQYKYEDMGDGTSLKVEVTGFGYISENGNIDLISFEKARKEEINAQLDITGTFEPVY